MSTTTSTKAPTGAPTFHPHGQEMKAMLGAAERIFAHAPDVRPQPYEPRLVSKSNLNTWAKELTARLRAKYRGTDTLASLHGWLKDLPGMLLATDYNEATIVQGFDCIDAALHTHDHPKPPPPLHPGYAEVARDLGITLPAGLDAATTALRLALMSRWSGDRRAEPIWQNFVGQLLSGNGTSLVARRARHMLDGFAFGPVRPDDATFGGDVAELWPAIPAAEPREWRGDIGAALLALIEPTARELRLSVTIPPFPGAPMPDPGEKTRLHQARDRRQLVPMRARRADESAEAWAAAVSNNHDANERECERLEEKLRIDRADNARARQLFGNEWLDGLRLRIVAVMDAALSRDTIGSLRWFWIREARCALAGPRPELGTGDGGYSAVALATAKSLGATFDIGGQQ